MTVIKTDLAIIGTGIIGASCAYHATKRGLSVAMIDARQPTAGTSGSCDGYVAISSKKPGLVMELAAASKRIYPDICKALRIDPQYHPVGGLLICEDEATRDRVEDHVEAVRACGVEMNFLDNARMLDAEPNLNPEIFGAFEIPIEAIVSPYRMTLALVDAARAAGATAHWNTRPVGFEMDGARIAAMDTTAGRVVAQQYVFAAGIWSRALGAMVGIDLPVTPRRGELVVTERCGGLAKRYLQSARYLIAKGKPDEVATTDDPLMRLGHGFCMEVNAEGQCVIGSSRAFVGYDRSTTPHGVAAIIQEGVRYIPKLANVNILRTFSGLRPFVPDSKPIIGRSGIVENVIAATGHEGDGICLSQITGDIVADIAAGRTPALDVAPLSPDRFGPMTPEKQGEIVQAAVR